MIVGRVGFRGAGLYDMRQNPAVILRGFSFQGMSPVKAESGLACGLAHQRPFSVCALFPVHFQGCDEGFLGDFDLAELAHALFAFLLFIEKFALA